MMSLFPLDLRWKIQRNTQNQSYKKKQHPVFPDRCDADAQNNNRSAKDKSKADNTFLCSLCSSFPGRSFSLGPTSAWQRLSFRWHSIKMHVCTTMWGTLRDGQDLTDTIFTSWQVHVQYQEKRRESVQGASINHAQRAAVVCMQDNYISSYQRCRNPNATFHSLQKTGNYLNNLGCKDSTSTAQRDHKLYSQYREDIDHLRRRESLFTTIRYSKIQPQMK